MWDRRVDGGFPEAKQLKQRVRDVITPTKFLGHSEDSMLTVEDGNKSGETPSDCIECEETRIEEAMTKSSSLQSGDEFVAANIISPNVSITYCTKYQWLFRSAWLSQEILTTFQEEINSVTLMPSRPLSKAGEGQFVSIFTLCW